MRWRRNRRCNCAAWARFSRGDSPRCSPAASPRWEESFVEALRIGAEALVDRLFLADIDETVLAAVLGKNVDWGNDDCLAVIESSTLAGVIEATDAAIKGCPRSHYSYPARRWNRRKRNRPFAGRTGRYRGGPVEIGCCKAQRHDRLIQTSIIPRLDGDVRAALASSTRFAGGPG